MPYVPTARANRTQKAVEIADAAHAACVAALSASMSVVPQEIAPLISSLFGAWAMAENEVRQAELHIGHLFPNQVEPRPPITEQQRQKLKKAVEMIGDRRVIVRTRRGKPRD